MYETRKALYVPAEYLAVFLFSALPGREMNTANGPNDPYKEPRGGLA